MAENSPSGIARLQMYFPSIRVVLSDPINILCDMGKMPRSGGASLDNSVGREA